MINKIQIFNGAGGSLMARDFFHINNLLFIILSLALVTNTQGILFILIPHRCDNSSYLVLQCQSALGLPRCAFKKKTQWMDG